MQLTPYPSCIGSKVKRKKLRLKAKRPISCKKFSIIADNFVSQKNKIKFIEQLFIWFNKDSKNYKVNYFLKNKYYISDCDFINLSVKMQKAGLKNLLLKLNYHLKDYKTLKRRSYTLNFTFFFLDIKNNRTKEVTLDIVSNKYDTFNIFIITNSFYIEEFYDIINILNKKKKEKDHNDLILEELDYIFSWNRLDVAVYYDVYMPWYLKKENYYMQKEYKRKNERKHFCIIKEKKLKTIFPLKNVIGHVIVTEKNQNDEYIYWKTLFKNQNFKKKDDLFKELKSLIKMVNNTFKINTTLAYFFIEIIK